MLPIAEKIRSLRQKRNITQTELAEALGISFQSVSRWERGMAYPDIEMIPKIAAFFGVTTDELLVANDDAKEQELEKLYWEYHMKDYMEEDPKKKLELSMETYAKFPKEHKRTCNIASDICQILVERNVLPREEALPIVRELCTILLNQNTDPMFHNWALRYIYKYEDEDKLDDWQKYVGKYGTESDFRELRYLHRGEYDRYNKQLQVNMYEKLTAIFPIHAHKHFADSFENAHASAEAAELSLRIFDIFREDGCDNDIFLRHRAWTYLYLAKSRFHLGETDAAYEALGKSVDLCEIMFSQPPEQLRGCAHPCFDLLTVSGRQRIDGERNEYKLDGDRAVFYSALHGDEGQWSWFKPHLEEPRYIEILERFQKIDFLKNSRIISEEEMKKIMKKHLENGGKLIPQEKKGAE